MSYLTSRLRPQVCIVDWIIDIVWWFSSWEIYRKESTPAFTLLWPSRNWKDKYNPRRSTSNIWQWLSKTDPWGMSRSPLSVPAWRTLAAQCIRRQRHRCRPGANQTICRDPYSLQVCLVNCLLQCVWPLPLARVSSWSFWTRLIWWPMQHRARSDVSLNSIPGMSDSALFATTWIRSFQPSNHDVHAFDFLRSQWKRSTSDSWVSSKLKGAPCLMFIILSLDARDEGWTSRKMAKMLFWNFPKAICVVHWTSCKLVTPLTISQWRQKYTAAQVTRIPPTLWPWWTRWCPTNSPHLIKVCSFTFSWGRFLDCLAVINKLKTERGLALQDLITGAYEYVETIDFPPQARVYLLDYMATTEWAFDHHALHQ